MLLAESWHNETHLMRMIISSDLNGSQPSHHWKRVGGISAERCIHCTLS